MFYWYGCSIRKLTVWSFWLSFDTRTSCKFLIIWSSFYWEVARTLHGIVLIICYIFGQLFSMPCGVTCEKKKRFLLMMKRDGLDIRFTMYVQKFTERYFAARTNFRIFYRASYNETLWIISYVCCIAAL